ncbi:hypothetical protein [Streptomyces sp. NPDC088794]|uniref:hypothetical protein n=1 Tax=Streptomyces sp. NPDC088794 TaxID=3365902 RepID=UPI003824AC94
MSRSMGRRPLPRSAWSAAVAGSLGAPDVATINTDQVRSGHYNGCQYGGGPLVGSGRDPRSWI